MSITMLRSARLLPLLAATVRAAQVDDSGSLTLIGFTVDQGFIAAPVLRRRRGRPERHFLSFNHAPSRGGTMATFGRSRILPPALSCALTLFALAGPSSATAQRRAPDAFTDVARPSATVLAPPQAASTPSVGHLIVGACLGSAVGLVAGSGIGYALGGEGWDMLGFFGGSVVGSALGVKLAARHDGSRITFASALTGGLLGTVAGLWGPLVVGNDAPLVSALLFSLTQGTVAGLWGRSHTQR